jgi:hypothetical protein
MEAEIRWNGGAAMTDEEERKELMADLGQICLDTHTTREVCLRAAEEIERLAEELKRSQTIARELAAELAAELGYVFDRIRGGIRDRS